MYKNPAKGIKDSNVALINATGLSLAAFGITTAVGRSYTPSWASAAVLGLFGAFAALFFMAAPLIDSVSSEKRVEGDVFVKKDSPKVAEAVKANLKPAKKLVPFRQQS